jgi:signal transduction histidine kinase
VKLTANTKNILINYFTAEEIIIFADKNILDTILRNLISNAIKFTNNGGKIDIYAEINHKIVTITVSDNGIGITQKLKNKLFDISQTQTTKGTEGESGTGLGLLLCKEFVEKHGGTIWVESKEGKGSDFKFTMPLCYD